MSDLIRIVYVSRSSFPPRPAEHGIEPGVARILAQSLRNNARRGLVGALHFGDGCFFQCLEGQSAEVDRVMATLRADPRHTDLAVLSRAPIERPGFSAWPMRYVGADAAMAAPLRERGVAAFDPYRFDAAIVEAVLALLRTGDDGSVVPPRTGPDREALEAPSRHALRTARWAFGTAAIALAAVVAMAATG